MAKPSDANGWEAISPKVNLEREFLEIANDFGNPLEIVREAISNSIDAGATTMSVSFDVREVDGIRRLVIEFEDNGSGMNEPVLKQDFWGLGFSNSRTDNTKIGEKGHGTKIYLRSERVHVKTQTKEEAWESQCERPMQALAQGKPHQPAIRRIQPYRDGSGTTITVIGYNNDERTKYVRDIVHDYVYWFTKAGSIETGLKGRKAPGLSLKVKCLGQDAYEELKAGHPFPEVNDDIKKLFETYAVDAADHFVKRYDWSGNLERFPEVRYDCVVSVEGDQAKRDYNKMIRERRRKDTGRYKVSDRYGIWLCKDFIPVDRVNDWISGFGTGSNSLTLLHGFLNCQDLKLTANRGSISNTDPQLLEELKALVQVKLDEINGDLHKEGIYTLVGWQSEKQTVEQEKSDFDNRTKSIKNRKTFQVDGRTFLEPRNEAELFGLFSSLCALRPEVFPFEPLDYNTNRGIDMIVRNRTRNPIADSELSYLELKYSLKRELNHGFKYLRWIVCWDFDKDVSEGTDFEGIEEGDVRTLEISKKDCATTYFLNPKGAPHKTQIIRLKEYLVEKLALTLDAPKK